MRFYSIDYGFAEICYSSGGSCVFGHGLGGRIDCFRELAGHLGIPIENFIAANEEHTVKVRDVGFANAGESVLFKKDPKEREDGLITNERGLVLCVTTADCVPVFILDERHKAVGIVHSGWRGTVGGVAIEALKEMKSAFGTEAADVRIAFGPCICGKCYEVEEDFALRFVPEARVDSTHVDLKAAIVESIKAYGVAEERIDTRSVCCYENEEFYSWRRHQRDGKAFGQIISCVYVK